MSISKTWVEQGALFTQGIADGIRDGENAALHSCLACGRRPSTHEPANADSDDSCPMCGLGDERLGV